MQTVANLWWLWLTLMVVFGGYTLYNQIMRMKRMVKTTSQSFGHGDNAELSFGDDFEATASAFTKGVGLLAVSGGIAWLSMILFLFSVLLNIFKY
jgi:hypothetical protein